MKRKKLLTSCLSLLLAGAMAFPSFAFYRTPTNKKGVLCSDINMLDDIVELGASQVILNFNVGTSDPAAFVNLLTAMNQKGLTVTMIVNNTCRPGDAIVPEGSSGALNGMYSFNASSQEGIAMTTRVASETATAFANLVSNWIIGNEVNNEADWNKFSSDDFEAYTKNYAEAFRIFYNQIKTTNPEARVFIPFDHNWNQTVKAGWFTSRETLMKLNSYLSDTDYGIAWHPYPQDFMNADFTNNSRATESTDTPIVNMKNLHILTDAMQQPELLSPTGAVRHLLMSEAGFNSNRGEAVQALAVYQAYHLANENPYVEGFLINRLEDAPPEVAQGYSFGLWYTSGSESNPTSRKLAWTYYQQAQ